MIGLYLACLLFGAILLGASMVLGGHAEGHAGHELTGGHEAPDGHELEHEAPESHDGLEHDHAHEGGDHDAPAWQMLLSMRFWTYLIGSFGAIGLLLTLFGIGTLAGAVVAGIGSLTIGGAIATLFRWFAREQVTGDVGVGNLVGQEARVMLPIRPGGIGQIAIQTSAGREEMTARTRDGKILEPGQLVLIANIEEGVADVTSLRVSKPDPTKTRETP